jgi:hypothetical protein
MKRRVRPGVPRRRSLGARSLAPYTGRGRWSFWAAREKVALFSQVSTGVADHAV